MLERTYKIEYQAESGHWYNVADTGVWPRHISFKSSYTDRQEAEEHYKTAHLIVGGRSSIKKLVITKSEQVESVVAESALMPWELEKLISAPLILRAEDYFYKVDDMCLTRQRFKIIAFNSDAPRHNRSYNFFKAYLQDNVLGVYALDDYLETFKLYTPYTKYEI